MAFRRDDEEGAFAKWRRAQSDFIVAAGVPEFIVASRGAWLRFLDSGYFEESGPSRHFDYDVRHLPRDEQERLLQLIETYPGGAHSEAIKRLRRLFSEGAE